LRLAIEAGVRKVNFATDLYYAFLDGVRAMGDQVLPVDLFMREPTRAVKDFAVDRIRRLGAG
jgi:fructose/tagatose bisphosphate aldolase